MKKSKKHGKSSTVKKRKTTKKPTKTVYSTARQLVQWIPEGLIGKLAHQFKLDIRKFSAVSHVVALLIGQLTGVGCLNHIVDMARVHNGEWTRIRGAQPPKRNTFSNANRTRNPEMAEALYWQVFYNLIATSPTFNCGRKHRKFLSRFKASIHAIDSSTIKLALNSIGWARHRAKKAAAKLHLRLDVGSRLPAFAVVEEASHHDSKRASALCAGLKADDILLGDRAYVDFDFLNDLRLRGIHFVLRLKKNIKVRTVRKLPLGKPAKRGCKGVIRDRQVKLVKSDTRAQYPEVFRAVTARVEVNGKLVEMEFITDNMEWSAWTVAELYRARWEIETFFKELKQTCQISDFVGYNEKAVRWQVWIGLLAHLLLRFQAHISKWGLSFSRLAGVVRHALWVRRNINELLEFCGMAGGLARDGTQGKPLYLQGEFILA